MQHKKDIINGIKKFEIIKIVQDNQHMLKRLNKRTSFYDVKKWEDQYEKTQTYKKNICVFPMISFHKKTETAEVKEPQGNLNEAVSHHKARHDHVMYCKQCSVGTLEECMVLFAVRHNQFIIQVENLNEPEKVYMLVFDAEGKL